MVATKVDFVFCDFEASFENAIHFLSPSHFDLLGVRCRFTFRRICFVDVKFLFLGGRLLLQSLVKSHVLRFALDRRQIGNFKPFPIDMGWLGRHLKLGQVVIVQWMLGVKLLRSSD